MLAQHGQVKDECWEKTSEVQSDYGTNKGVEKGYQPPQIK